MSISSGGDQAAEHTISHWLRWKGSAAFGHEMGASSHPHPWGKLGVLPWDKAGAAPSLHKGEAGRAGDLEQTKPQDWKWLSGEERSQLGPSVSVQEHT